MPGNFDFPCKRPRKHGHVYAHGAQQQIASSCLNMLKRIFLEKERRV